MFKKIFSYFNRFILGFVAGILSVFGIKYFFSKRREDLSSYGKGDELLEELRRRAEGNNREIETIIEDGQRLHKMAEQSDTGTRQSIEESRKNIERAERYCREMSEYIDTLRKKS